MCLEDMHFSIAWEIYLQAFLRQPLLCSKKKVSKPLATSASDDLESLSVLAHNM